MAAYATPEAAAGAYAQLATSRRLRRLLTQVPPRAPDPPDASGARALVEQALHEGRHVLTDPEARRLLAAYGVPVFDSHEARTPQEAGAAAQALRGPVALKILSRQLSHKSDVGGVRLGLTGQETFDIVGVEALNGGEVPREVTVRAGDKEFRAVVRIDTPGEADYYRHGGIMQYVLRSLLRK